MTRHQHRRHPLLQRRRHVVAEHHHVLAVGDYRQRTRSPSAPRPRPFSISRPSSTSPSGYASAAVRPPGDAHGRPRPPRQRGDARVQRTLGQRPRIGRIDGRAPPVDNTTSAASSVPLSMPDAVTASRSGSRSSTSDKLPAVPRIQPRAARRAAASASAAPASLGSRVPAHAARCPSGLMPRSSPPPNGRPHRRRNKARRPAHAYRLPTCRARGIQFRCNVRQEHDLRRRPPDRHGDARVGR